MRALVLSFYCFHCNFLLLYLTIHQHDFEVLVLSTSLFSGNNTASSARCLISAAATLWYVVSACQMYSGYFGFYGTVCTCSTIAFLLPPVLIPTSYVVSCVSSDQRYCTFIVLRWFVFHWPMLIRFWPHLLDFA